MLNSPEWLHDFFYNIFKCFIFDDRYLMFVRGLSNTLLLTFFALILGVVLGVTIALVRVTWDKNGCDMHGAGRMFLSIANKIAKIYLTIIRGTPMVVQLLIMYFVIFASSNNKLFVGCLAFGINSGAYVAEIIRGGIMSVDAGQMEAGRSLGFNYVQTMIFIVIPQAFKTVLPALANEFIVLLKETAVAGYIGMPDLTYASNIVGGTTFVYFYPLLAAALIYLVMVMFFTWLVGKLELRLRSSEGRETVQVRRKGLKPKGASIDE
ncbi:MAG: amino acid ABC transporter permease [Clostridia bacterium]|nr:amino acid ABC transporter permease [Clostridia bacterium]